jgi:uncharacterized cupredoxin-like copper-binding protein
VRRLRPGLSGAAIALGVLAGPPLLAAPQPVTVILKEYAFVPSRLVFQHGVEYRLHLQNTGKEFHEFTAPDFLKAIHIESPGVVNRYGNEVDMPPGTQKDLLFTAPRPGHYRLWCADHDWAGMTGSITVK